MAQQIDDYSMVAKTVYNSKKWRLIHDGINVITLIDGTLGSVTNTKQFVLECDTEKEALNTTAVKGFKQRDNDDYIPI